MDGSAQQRKIFDATLRPRRQITLPAEICEALSVELGDQLDLEITADAVIIRKKRGGALDALREIQRAFAATDLTDNEVMGAQRRIREQATRVRYGEG